MQFLKDFKHNLREGQFFRINQYHNKCSASIREFELALLKLKIIENSSGDWGGATHRITKQDWAIRETGIRHFWRALEWAFRSINK